MDLKKIFRGKDSENQDFFEHTLTPKNNRTPVTEHGLEKLIDDDVDGCVFYNLIQNKPMKRMYNSHMVVGIQQIRNNVPLFFERYNQCCPNVPWQPIALTAKVSDFASRRKPAYHPLGRHIFGNLIMHNNTTQDYSLLVPQWVHVVPLRCVDTASEEALYQSFLYFLHNPRFIAEQIKKFR